MTLSRALIATAAVATAVALIPTSALAQTEPTTGERPRRTTSAPRHRGTTTTTTTAGREQSPTTVAERAPETTRRTSERYSQPTRPRVMPDQSVDGIATRCLAQIDRRRRTLDADNDQLDSARGLTEAHKETLVAINDQASAGLAALADEIQVEDNPEELRVICRRIVEDFRVYVLVRPRARLVVISDRLVAATTEVQGVGDRIQSAIDRAKADGKVTSEAEADLAAMRQALASARTKAAGIYDAVIGLTAADYNANPDVLDPARADARSARELLREAVTAARSSIQHLRGTAR